MTQKNLEISVLLDIYSPLLPEKQRTALDFYYNEDLSLSEIAEHVGISRQGVRDQIKHAEAQLFEYENALHLYEKSQKTEEILERLSHFACQIKSEQLDEILQALRNINE